MDLTSASANWFTGTATHSFDSLAAIDELHHALIPKMQAAALNATFSTLIELQPLTPSMVRHAAARATCSAWSRSSRTAPSSTGSFH